MKRMTQLFVSLMFFLGINTPAMATPVSLLTVTDWDLGISSPSSAITNKLIKVRALGSVRALVRALGSDLHIALCVLVE